MTDEVYECQRDRDESLTKAFKLLVDKAPVESEGHRESVQIDDFYELMLELSK